MKIKKFLSFLLSVVMLLSITAGTDLSAYARIASSGNCGANAKYTFDEDTITLTISGSGSISNSAFLNENEICFNLKIADGISSIGSYAFCGSGVKYALIPESVTSIEAHAFGHNGYGKAVVILNPNCYIADDGIYSYMSGDIYGFSNSTAEQYAQKNGLTFKSIDGYNCSAGKHITVYNFIYEECVICQNAIVEEITDTETHNWSSIITTQSTCISTGVKTYICSNCGETKTESIPKKTHTYKNVTTKATDKKNGKIESKCTVCGTVSKTTAINSIKSISLAKTSYTYDGKAKKPTVTVKDSKGKKIDAKYYTVKYSSNKNVGKATVTVTFKGNYSGTVKKTFTIKPKRTSISKLTAGKKKFTVKWKKLTTQTTGYEIQYSTDKNFKKNNKTVTVSKNKTTSKSISKLKAKKKYYIRIRTYKTVNGTKIYSDWSKTKNVTTKK